MTTSDALEVARCLARVEVRLAGVRRRLARRGASSPVVTSDPLVATTPARHVQNAQGEAAGRHERRPVVPYCAGWLRCGELSVSAPE
jgi:hypothetical protein